MNGANSRPQKTAMIVAQRVVGDIVRQGLRPGDLLPPEKVMLETYSAGRGTLREALRLLEFQGVIALKPGPKGGPVLLEPDSGHLSSTIILLMQLRDAPLESVHEVRIGIEPMISRLAAERMSDDSLEELQATITQMTDRFNDEHLFLEANARFHDLIAWSSGNVLFGYIVDSLIGIMDGSQVGMHYPPVRRKATIKAHEEILHALSERDPSASEERMRDHIRAGLEYGRKKFPDAMKSVVRWDRPNG